MLLHKVKLLPEYYLITQHSGDGDGDANCYVHVHCTGLRKPPRQPAAVLCSVLRTRNITEMDPTPHCLHSLHY